MRQVLDASLDGVAGRHFMDELQPLDRFDVEDLSLCPPRLRDQPEKARLKSFPVEVRDGVIWVDLGEPQDETTTS